MTTGQKIEAQLDELDSVKEGLIDALEDKGASIDPGTKLNDLIDVVDSLEVNDGYRYTKFGLSPLNKASYVNYQDELNKIDFRNFGLDGLFIEARLQTVPDFSNCKNINVITNATETFKKAYFSGASTNNLTKLANLHLPNSLTSLLRTFADVNMVDLTGLSFPNVSNATGIFRNSDTSQSAQQTNLIIAGHNEADFTNISSASEFYYNRSITFYNTDGTLYTDTIDGTTFSGTIYTLTNKTFPNLTTINNFMYHYSWCNQKAIKIVNCNFPNLTNCGGAFSGRATTGAPADYTMGISHLYIKDCTFDKSLNLSNLFLNNGGLTTIIIDCPNKIKVSNLNSAFSGVKGLIEFPADKFDVTGCSNFKYTFRSCQSLESLDLSSWVKSSGDFSSMFEYCTKLKHLDIRNIEFSKIASSYTGGLLMNVPKDCEIIVKNDTEKQWFNTKWNAWTNVKTVAEYEAE